MGAPIGSRPAVGPANGGRPLPSTPKPAVTKQSPQKPLPRPTATPLDVEADFEMMNNRSFNSMVPDIVNTTTFSVTVHSTNTRAHYVLLPEDTLKTKEDGNTFETAILEVVSEKLIRDPKVSDSKRLAYILCEGNRRVLVCDASQLKKFKEVDFFALNFNGEGAIFSLRGRSTDSFGISLAGRDDGDITLRYKKALDIYKRTFGISTLGA